MGELPTARDYAGVHTVHGVCPNCDHWQELDLAAIVAGGQGDIPLVQLPLRLLMQARRFGRLGRITRSRNATASGPASGSGSGKLPRPAPWRVCYNATA